jgi:hypothetical protein
MLESSGVGEGSIANFVEGVGGVGDEFTEENLLVGVEGVYTIRLVPLRTILQL